MDPEAEIAQEHSLQVCLLVGRSCNGTQCPDRKSESATATDRPSINVKRHQDSSETSTRIQDPCVESRAERHGNNCAASLSASNQA